MQDYRFDSRLARGETLPSRYYVDTATLEQEQRDVFGRSWQLVGRAEQVAEPGSFFTTSVGGEPLVVVRGKDGALRAFSNVCRHRAGPVASGEGKRPSFVCGYHGWSYALDGRLLSTPEFDGVEGFDREAICLPEYRVDILGALVLVNLDAGAPPLREVYGEIAPLLEAAPRSAYRLATRKDWELDCNWKAYVDNYLEGYHIPIVHPSLHRELDYQRYRTETKQWYSQQHAPVRRPERIRVTADEPEARYYWIYPNLMINVYADNFSTNLILPRGPRRTLTVFEWFFPERGARADVDATVAFSDEIQLEDIAICEAVQRGLESRSYDRGRYSVARENGVHHFHGLYAEAMGIERA
ncbi:MAG: aromatic ring-hydroxylating oxygenase subunit alpha [Thermoanaerobaculia bacterium]